MTSGSYDRAPTPWSTELRSLTVGLLLTITLVATESLSVATVMPLVARDLGGVELYGWVFSSFLLATMVGIVAAGRVADRAGPARPYVAGLGCFALGLTVAGSATSMPMLIAGRVLQGVGAGVVPAVAYVTIGRCYPEDIQARMMAYLSTAWVVPGLVGPLLSAAVAHLVGWRWIFFGLLPFVALSGLLAARSLQGVGRPDVPPQRVHRMIDAFGVTGAAGVVLAGLAGTHRLLSALAVSCGGVVLLLALRRLVPEGTLLARNGLPATIAVRGLLTFAFFGGDAFVTLAVVTYLHHSLAAAGIAVTGSTLAWTGGAWMQARLNGRWEGRRLVGLGLLGVVTGSALMAVAIADALPVVVIYVAWSVAGLGIGLAYAPLTLMMLRAAEPGSEGWASSSLTLVDCLGSALGAGVGGATVAIGERNGHLGGGLVAAFVAATSMGVVGLWATRRLPVESSPEEIGHAPGANLT